MATDLHVDGSSIDAARRRARFAAAGFRDGGSPHLRIAAGEPTAGSLALDRDYGASDDRCTRNIHVFRNGTRRPSVMGAVTARRFQDEGAAVVLTGRAFSIIRVRGSHENSHCFDSRNGPS
jgi:hypothetical protein